MNWCCVRERLEELINREFLARERSRCTMCGGEGPGFKSFPQSATLWRSTRVKYLCISHREGIYAFLTYFDVKISALCCVLPWLSQVFRFCISDFVGWFCQSGFVFPGLSVGFVSQVLYFRFCHLNCRSGFVGLA